MVFSVFLVFFLPRSFPSFDLALLQQAQESLASSGLPLSCPTRCAVGGFCQGPSTSSSPEGVALRNGRMPWSLEK